MQHSFISSGTTWWIVGASVAGTSHLKNGQGCDDASDYCQLPDGSLVIAVADGAGSSSRSAEGAAHTVRVALSTALTLLSQQPALTSAEQWLEMLGAVVTSVRTSLEELAVGSVIHPDSQLIETQELTTSGLRDLATTLLLTVVTSQWIAAAQIGDGAVVVQYADGTMHALTEPDHGEYINETSFITEDDYLNHLQYKALQIRVRSVALLTDGLQMLALDVVTNTPYEPFFVPLFRFAAEADAPQAKLKDFLESERVCSRTDDDKTLVLAVRP